MKFLLVLITTLILNVTSVVALEADVDLLEQQAWQQAANVVAPSVVQIHTVGGLNRVGETFITKGPTTGVIVSADGYIVSSAFNFAAEPTSILVKLASGKQLAAELIARDKNRLLTLLKVESAEPLPVVETASLESIQVGQWAIAVGHTFKEQQVNVSVGIVSGLNRRYGRVIQTDASISVANYGGPLVNVYGQAMGILVPMAPQGSGGDSEELAGADFYDSGIGFAVPLTHVNSILERWKQGEDLLPGKLGVAFGEGPPAISPPKISAVWPASPAAEAGWKADDLIVAINGEPVKTQSHLKFHIVPRYAGETVNISIRRGEEEIESSITLAGEMQPYRTPFLGILPTRAVGEESSDKIQVHSVWPNSPAEKAGILAGDVIKQINDTEITSRQEAHTALDAFQPEQALGIKIVRGEDELTLSADLAGLPLEILEENRLVTSKRSNNENNTTPELEPLNQLDVKQSASYYDPAPDSSASRGLVLWLANRPQEEDSQVLSLWQEVCQRDHLILLIAHPTDETGWTNEDLPVLDKLVGLARRRWSPDTQRIVIAGSEKAGQLAFALAFAKQKDYSGVIGIDAPLPRSLNIAANRPGNRFATLAVESKDSTFAPLIRDDLNRLGQAGYPASWLQLQESGTQQEILGAEVIDALGRWINGLDRF